MNEINAIQLAQQALTIAERELSDAVARARTAGHSWATIGEALNISRQAAFKRFGSTTNPFTGETMTPRTTTELPHLAETFIRHIAAGEETPTMDMMHKGVHKDLPWTKIADVWTDILTDIGALENITDSVVTGVRGTRESAHELGEQTLGTTVVISTLNHEAGELMSRVAFDRDHTIVGLLFLPMGTTEFPF